MILTNGILQGIPFLRSPHCNTRPHNTPIDLIVIHCISLPEGHFGTPHVHDLFMGTLNPDAHESFESLRNLNVSAHIFISRNGDITQFVPFHERAWHAGISHFQGRDQCNDFSIGIELEGTDQLEFTEAQYASLLPLIQALQRQYPAITQDRIVGHEDIAPGRKTDPGRCFDWGKIKNIASQAT